MRPSPRLERALGPTLILLPPLLACLLVSWGLLWLVSLREQAIAPVNGGGLAPFVQIAWSWNQGLGWLQTVRWETTAAWWWDQHWGPLFIPIAWLSHLLDGPWALCRVQALLLGAGVMGAWLLGWSESRAPGGLAALLLYSCSAPALLVATADFQLLSLALPLLPITVWAARHASLPLFVLLAVLLAAGREELLVLLPLAGLAGGLPRAAVGCLLAVAWALLLHHQGGFLTGNSALVAVLAESWSQAEGPAVLPMIDWGHYARFCGPGLPWLLLAPTFATGAWCVAAFQYLPGSEFVSNPGWSFLHHLAPLVALATCGGIIGVGRLMRALPRLRLLVLLAVALGCALSLQRWRGDALPRVLPVGEAARHPAWDLLVQVPDDAVLLTPARIAPAAAQRRWLVMPQSLGVHIQPAQVTHVIDDGQSIERELKPDQPWRPQGSVLSRSAGWSLVEIEAP
jgi:hypothetical protein